MAILQSDCPDGSVDGDQLAASSESPRTQVNPCMGSRPACTSASLLYLSCTRSHVVLCVRFRFSAVRKRSDTSIIIRIYRALDRTQLGRSANRWVGTR